MKELTNKQKAIKDRQLLVGNAYAEKGDRPSILLVDELAKKLRVTQVTIWNDLKKLGLTNGKGRKGENI